MNIKNVSKGIIASMVGGIGALAISGAALADPIAGGVDFGDDGSHTHIETTTVAETLINGNNQTLTGYGQVTTINGNTAYTTTAGQTLYFVFTNYLSNSFTGSSVAFTGGTVQIYLGNAFNLKNQSSATDIATIEGYSPFLTLTGHASNGTTNTLTASGTLSGSTIGFTGAGLLDVTGGLSDVIALLNTNTLSDFAGGFADVAFTSSGQNVALNSHDDTTGCKNGTAAAGQYCIAGSAALQGVLAVPEPDTTALFGLAAVGMALSLRRRKARN